MREDTFERSRFAVVMRGYDRDQVDAILEACERWAREAQAHMEATDAKLAEADRQAEGLEARLSELESRDARPPRSIQALTERAEQMLNMAREAGDELQATVEAEARDDKERAGRAAAELRQGAKAKAEEIAASARRHEEELAPSTREARKQATLCIEEGRVVAAERADAVRQRAEGPIREVQKELSRLEDERKAALDELSGLQSSLDGLVAVS